MTTRIPAQPKSGPAKPGPRPGSKPRPKPVAADRPVDPRPADGAPAVEEWPPREWRETTRSAGQRQALYVALAMVVMFGVLVAVNIWGARNG